jgi:hypothetical protein
VLKNTLGALENTLGALEKNFRALEKTFGAFEAGAKCPWGGTSVILKNSPTHTFKTLMGIVG